MLPFAGPRPVLDNGLLWTVNGRIAQIGPYRQVKNEFSAPIHDLGEQTLTPGLVNAHTHLELSHLHNATQPGQGFLPWVQSLIRHPLKQTAPERIQGLVQDMLDQGLAGVGDISGHAWDHMYEVHAQLPIASRLFIEFLGFRPKPSPCWPVDTPPDAEFISAAGHALYSTSPDLLRRVKEWTTRYGRPFSMHLAEHIGEVELLSSGRGEFADFLRGRLFPASYTPPGCSPVAYAHRLGLLDQHTLAVHCVHLGRQDIALLANNKARVCICPRSNAYIGCGRAPVEDLYRAGIPLSLATDGLSSNHDLNLWNEASYLAGMWEGNLSLTDLVAMITINPARALGLDQVAGSLQPGKLGRFSLVPEDMQASMPV
jgi:cytosine/adenosine deaminase-related metal-dependent hydrolase